MFYKVVFLLGQFVKEICSEIAWTYNKDIYMLFSVIVVG